MKKTSTVNLSGIVFHIDEDAYEMLNNYLEALGRHFAAEDRDEILKDIEARVAELFTERLINRNVVEIQDVEYVIETMGHPSDFEDENTQSEPQSKTTFTAEPSNDRKKRKLFRDASNKKIGGVAAGFAAYMDWDPTIVRIIFLLILFLSFGWTLFIYILLWIFMPEATSVAQRLEMQGVEPTAENISNYNTYASTDHVNSNTSWGSSPLAKAIKICAAGLLGLIGIGLFASVLGIIIVSILLVFNLLPIAATANSILMLISVGLFLICPAIAIVLFCIYLFSGNQPRHKWVAWTLFGIWIASIVGICVTSAKAVRSNQHTFKELIKACDDWDDKDDDNGTVNFLKQTCLADNEFNAIEVDDAINVQFTQADSTSIEFKAPDKLMKYIKTEIRKGTLYIRNDNTTLKDKTVTVYVTAPNLEKVSVSEASSFRTTGDLNLSKLDLEVSEASTVNISGKIDTLNVKAEEASSANLKKVTADVAIIKAEEASKVEMGKARDLQITSNEASKVTYQGQPERLMKSSSNLSITRWEN